MCQTLNMHHLFKSPQQCWVVTLFHIISFIRGDLGFRELKQLAQGCMARKSSAVVGRQVGLIPNPGPVVRTYICYGIKLKEKNPTGLYK